MKRIAILATGGTIAGVGEAGKNLGYHSGSLSVDSLVGSLGHLLSHVAVELATEQVCNVNSDDMTDEIWLKLTHRINELEQDESVDGIVITHGTDTMDETVYFLHLTFAGNKPVVLTGSMRPATAAEPDGPGNLADAIQVAASLPFGGVFVCFGGFIYDAARMQKLSANALNPMGVHYAGEGYLANVADGVSLAPEGALPTNQTFDVSCAKSLPRVNVLYFAIDSDPSLLEYAAKISDGIVIAGAGSGEFSLKFADALARVTVPVVIASRIGQGLVTVNRELAPQGISAGALPPQKATVLLRLALTKTKDPAEIRRVFKKFA